MNTSPLALILSAILFPGQGRVESISADYQPEGLRRLSARTAGASSTLGDNYAPAKAIDDNHGTKWVASQTPGKASPQWITLTLRRPVPRVSAVAVHGEPVDNDGVLDAQVQIAVADDKQFEDVASIQNATSARWVATFEPVITTAVRLLITRSGGPTSHTDIYEIQLFGPPPNAEEQQREAAQSLAEAKTHLENSSAAVATMADVRLPVVDRTLEQQRRDCKDASTRFGTWDTLSETDRTNLAARIDQLRNTSEQLDRQIERLTKTWPARAKDIASARTAAKSLTDSGKPVAVRQDSRIVLANNRVTVSLNETDSTWDATWLGRSQAALRAARFSVEVNGKLLPISGTKAETGPFTDPLGTGLEIRQQWNANVRIDRSIRIYHDRPAVVVSGRITNSSDRDVTLGTTCLIDLSEKQNGWWYTGQVFEAPAAVYVAGSAQLACQPARGVNASGATDLTYGSGGTLALVNREPTTGLVVGYLTARLTRPDVYAAFRPGAGGTSLGTSSRFLGRKLGPGESLDLYLVYVAADPDPYAALETYADTAAKFASQPIRTGPTALWCSWYAHRMAMTEELVLANAAVAAKHFKPLGFEIIQLDHGWQRGDVTGDWVPNERFPHGLKWLANELKTRYGFKLGVWIAPTDVADTSETYREHRDWLLTDGEGKPRVNWKWYWAPNPNCYELDASVPAAAGWIEQVFARLSGWGVSYYKIDFIAASGSEAMVQHDPKATRGWSVMRRAMQAVRRGAGPEAWIRYCQTPPLLSAGLADSAYGGPDTLDAGLGGNIEVLRTNVRSLAAGYWLNDRLYHREVCDMSVRMQADIEEVRIRLAMMALAGCSISFSDELRFLPPSRIRMMQQCLPPGGPHFKPLDLFDRTIPSVWHLHCKTYADEWDVVGLFNLENQPEQRTIDLTALGLPEDAQVAVFEFWEEKFLGLHRKRLTLTLPGQTSRVLAIRRLTNRPQVVGTDMHVLQGFHEIRRMTWDDGRHRLSGEYRRMPGLNCKAFIYVPPGYNPHFDFPLNDSSAKLTHVGNHVWMQEIRFDEAVNSWSIPFDAPKK